MKIEDYELLESNVRNGFYLPKEALVKIPMPAKGSTEEMKAYQERCQEVLDLQSDKINALEAQLAYEKKKIESKNSQKESDALIVSFNSKLEEKYRRLHKKHEDESHENKKAIEALQELSDKVLEENKNLKEENKKLKEENAAYYDELCCRFEHDDYAPMTDEEWEWHEKEEREFEEYLADREPSVVRNLVNYCIDYVSDIDNVPDSHVDAIREMLESLLDNSSDVEKMTDSDKLKLTKRLHGIKKNRKAKELVRKNEMKETDNTVVTNNYFGSIGIKADNAGAINCK